MSKTANPTYKIIRDGDEKTFEDKQQFEDTRDLLDQNDVDFDVEVPDNTETEEESEPDDNGTEDGTQQSIQEPEQPEVVESEPTVVDTADTDANTVNEPTPDDPLSELGEELEADPLEILPDHMKDRIQGTPAVNKRGYAMIAERYGIEASADIVTFPWENEESRCVARATAETEDGRTYSGWATAAVSDGDMEDQIIELAETRALKRCVSWASGVGIVSYQELSNQLEDTE